MPNIQIVLYEPSYAARVADMWNRSGEGWGGKTAVRTEESVVSEHQNATHLAVFLALDGEEVVGYCSFSVYGEDDGALYIPLLNVRPDYHGRKVGKALVRHAVAKAVEMKWPRLDLYTWAGNTKAVPVYKKCGFFWEKRDNTTHLMNFLPTALNTEAVSDYFQQVDWYEDSVRTVEVVPDGRTENGFDYYEYDWGREGRRLRMEFERKGRGLRLIETDDYLIAAHVQEAKPVVGTSSTIEYEIRNKSGAPLQVQIRGKADQNITFTYEANGRVEGEERWSGAYHIGAMDEEPSEWRTHPAVAADIWVNGKQAELRVGVAPRYPVKASLHLPHREIHLGTLGTCYIELKNGFHEEVEVSFTLTETEEITFQQDEAYKVSLPASGRAMVEVPYVLKQFHAYKGTVTFRIERQDGQIMMSEGAISGIFWGRGSRFGGETEYNWSIVNGGYIANWNKFNNNLAIYSASRWDHHGTNVLYPKLGRPFSSEFSKKKPTKVEYIPDGESMLMRVTLDSDDRPGLSAVAVVRLTADGRLELHYEVHNAAEKPWREETSFVAGVAYSLYRTVVPYEGEYIYVEHADGPLPQVLNVDHIHENWLFSYSDRQTKALSWDPEIKVTAGEWYLAFEQECGIIPSGGSVVTKGITLWYDSFTDWQEFRTYVRRESKREPLVLRDSLELQVGAEGNPFVEEEVQLRVREFKQAELEGLYTFTSEKGGFSPLTIRAEDEVESQQRKELVAQLKLSPGGPLLDRVKLTVDSPGASREKQVLLIRKGKEAVRREQSLRSGLDVYTLDNGVVSISAAPDFSHGIFSMSYGGREWLDSSFPEAGPNSWWNPWFGGIYSFIGSMSLRSIQQERKSASFITRQDGYGNVWEGLRIEWKVEQHEECRGLEVHSDFLLLPGAPVMALTSEIRQFTGCFFNDRRWGTEGFFKPSEQLTSSWCGTMNREGEYEQFASGLMRTERTSRQPLMYGSREHGDRLLVTTELGPGGSVFFEGFVNTQLTCQYTEQQLMLPHGGTARTMPIFYLFGDRYLDSKDVRGLHGLRF